ncbi:hypothetical protein [Shinella granuli]|uniref:hypothetical protein n=1 Tax=Shinella granuli TaxID=323621 RepID=UPI0031F15C54
MTDREGQHGEGGNRRRPGEDQEILLKGQFLRRQHAAKIKGLIREMYAENPPWLRLSNVTW